MPNAATLLVFTVGADAETLRRGLLPAGESAVETELWNECVTGALAAGRGAGCRVEICSPAPIPLPEEAVHVPQPEGPFGARLERALGDAFARGAFPLVVVGTDVPGLAARHVAQALDCLDEDPERVVLGPSPDGGFYLLACSRPVAGLAAATRWCRGDTLRGLIRSLRAAGRPVILLEPLRDLDRRSDLERWLAARPGSRLARQLDRLLALRRRPPVPARLGNPLPTRLGALGGRSPPAFASF